MDTFISYCAFLGSWLLVAGSLYQAVLELKDEDIERDRIEAATANVEKGPTVSPWWWIVPPVKLYLEKKRNDAYRHEYVKQLDPDDLESVISFFNKATAWVFVATGGLLLALQETYGVTHRVWLFLLLAIAALAACIGNTIFRAKRSRKIIARHAPTES